MAMVFSMVKSGDKHMIKKIFGCILAFLSLSGVFAQHSISTAMKYKVVDIPYEIKITSVEYLTSNFGSVGTGTRSYVGSLPTCRFDTNLEVQGTWKVKVENNSDIDFTINTYTALKAHSTVYLNVFDNLYASASYLLYDYYANQWRYYIDYYGHVTETHNSLNKFLFFSYRKGDPGKGIPLSYFLKMDKACNIVEYKHTFSGNPQTADIPDGDKKIFTGTVKSSDLTQNATYLHDMGLE